MRGLLGLPVAFCGGFFESVVDVLRVEDGPHAERVPDDAFLILAFHAIFVMGLSEDDADDERVSVGSVDEDRAAAIAGESREVGQESGMGLDGEERGACENALPGHGEARVVCFEALWVSEDEERAANVNAGFLKPGFACKGRSGQSGDGDGQLFREAQHSDIEVFVTDPEGGTVLTDGDGMVMAFEGAICLRSAEHQNRRLSPGALKGMGRGNEIGVGIRLRSMHEEAGGS